MVKTPEERVADIELHWVTYPGSVTVRSLPDLWKNAECLVEAFRKAEEEIRQEMQKEFSERIKTNWQALIQEREALVEERDSLRRQVQFLRTQQN